MALCVMYEDFATPLADQPVLAEQLPGYDVGFAAGQATARSDQTLLTTEISQAILDLTFTYAEARRQVHAGLAPLFAAITDHALPMVASTALRADIVDHLQTAADTLGKTDLQLRVHPTHIEAITAALSPKLSNQIVITADPTLDPLVAVAGVCGGETLFDRDTLLQALSRAIDPLFQETDKGEHHG